MLGTKPMSRRAAGLGATLLSAGLVLSGCGNPSPSPTGDSSIIVPSQTPEPTFSVGAPTSAGSVPDLPGFELLFSARYEPSTSTLPVFDGVLVSEDYVAVYSNDLSAKTYEITGYRVSSGTKEWNHEGNGILSCYDGDVVVCETKSYTNGVWSTEDAWLLSMDVGGFRALDIGTAGSFSYVGNDDGDVYFLTWDGTRSVHMTGFDESGIPVVDKNLRVSPPAASENLTLETWMNGRHALIDFPGHTPILYDASTNLFSEVDVAAPCISVKDGAVCTSLEDPATVVGIDDRVREAWRHTTTAVSLLGAASEEVSLDDFKDLFLISQPPVTQLPEPGIEPGPGHPVPGKTAAATPATSSAQLVAISNMTVTADEKPDPSLQTDPKGTFPPGLDRLYATVAGKDAVLLPRADRTLSLPQGRDVALGDQTVESVDLSRKIAIVDVSAADPSAGESGSTRVVSSILVGEDGEVLSSLPSVRIAELFAGADAAGQQITAHTFAWQDEYLVFSDPSQGVVAIYKQK